MFLYTKGAFNGWYTWISGFSMSGQVDRTATIKKCLYIDACHSLYYLMLWKLEFYYTPKEKWYSVQINSPIRFFCLLSIFFNHHISTPLQQQNKKKKCISGGKVTLNFFMCPNPQQIIFYLIPEIYAFKSVCLYIVYLV